MKIVLIGLGSIGQRHLRNLLYLGYNKVSIVSRAGTLPGEFSFLPVYTSLAAALEADEFEAGIICTPTSYHIASIKALLQAAIPNIYIEKPVSHSYNEISDILTLANSYKNNIVVGYDLHFDPGMMKIKELLKGNAIGKVVSVNAQVGQYLPDWRPHEDYRKGMSAKHETGGGVMLDLIHEFDYLYWLNGSVKSVAAQYSHTGALQIETEDVAEVLLKFENNSIGSIHLDYLQPNLIRNCVIAGFEGIIKWNLAKNQVTWINRNKVSDEYNYSDFKRNDRFVSIMKSFLNDQTDPRLTSLKDGLKSLKLVLAAKHSSQRNVFVEMEDFNPLSQ